MSRSNMLVSGDRRLASELRTRTQDGSTYQEHHQHVIPTAIGAVPTLLSAFLGGASPDMAVNGSSTAVEFDLAPGSDAIYRVDRLSLVLACSAAVEMNEELMLEPIGRDSIRYSDPRGFDADSIVLARLAQPSATNSRNP